MERQHRLGAEAWLRDSLVVQDLVEKAFVSLCCCKKAAWPLVHFPGPEGTETYVNIS